MQTRAGEKAMSKLLMACRDHGTLLHAVSRYISRRLELTANQQAGKCRFDIFHRSTLWPRCFQIDGGFIGLTRESLLVDHQEVHAFGCVRYHKDHIPFLGAVALHYYGLIV